MSVAPTATPKPLVLIILDGFGHSDSPDFNAIHAARKPVYDRLLASQPHGCSAASRSTQKGITAESFSAKYQASSGMSYSTTARWPWPSVPMGLPVSTTRLMKW